MHVLRIVNQQIGSFGKLDQSFVASDIAFRIGGIHKAPAVHFNPVNKYSAVRMCQTAHLPDPDSARVSCLAIAVVVEHPRGIGSLFKQDSFRFVQAPDVANRGQVFQLDRKIRADHCLGQSNLELLLHQARSKKITGGRWDVGRFKKAKPLGVIVMGVAEEDGEEDRLAFADFLAAGLVLLHQVSSETDDPRASVQDDQPIARVHFDTGGIAAESDCTSPRYRVAAPNATESDRKSPFFAPHDFPNAIQWTAMARLTDSHLNK